MKSKNTKRALLMSVLSMLLCVSMLVGSTFAWFTDSVTSGNNRIVAGNLDVELEYRNASTNGEWKNASKESVANPNFFVDEKGNDILWEPGVMAVTQFRVVNKGTLALKYALATFKTDFNALDGHNLSEVIKFAKIDTDKYTADTTRESILAMQIEFEDFTGFTAKGELYPKKNAPDVNGPDEPYEEIFTVVAYWEPNVKDDNLYNVNNGKEVDKKDVDENGNKINRLYIDIDVHLNAWQNTVESDSFDNQYDAMAEALDIFPDGCYAVTNHDDWVELDIYTGRSTADINISYTGYAPDNTDDRMGDWTTNGSGTITPAAANGNTHLIFFKAADKGSFTLTQEDHVLSVLSVKESGTLRQSSAVYSTGNAVAATAAKNEVVAPPPPPAVTVDLSKAITVSSEAEMLSAIADLNNQNVDEKVVKLGDNIDLTGKWTLTNGTLTILGEGHSITNQTSTYSFFIGNTATLNFGADNYDNSLTFCVRSGYSTTTAPLIYADNNALVNICKDVVIDGKPNAVGGGVSIHGNATVNLLGGTIENCISHGSLGGGVTIVESSTFNMYRGEIKDCLSYSGPGAISITQSTGYPYPEPPAVFNMYGGTISGCQGKLGGAVYLDKASIFNMSGGTIENCKASMFGGGVCMGNDKAVFNMSGGRIERCEGANGGGVMVQYDAEFNMSGDATIANCEGGAGGGVCMIGSSKFNMSGDAAIVNCEGGAGGGVGVLHSSEFKMTGGTICECVAQQVGGGVYLQDTAVFDMSGGTIRGCASQQVGGGVYMVGNVDITIEDGFKLYGNTAGIAGDDIARQGDDAKLTLGNVNTDVMLSDGYAVDGWYIDEPDNRWGSENYPYDEAKIETGKTTAQFIKAAHGKTTAMKGVGAPGRLLDLYTGEDSIARISKGGAKTVRWDLKNSGIADRINASAPIKAGTKITMAYKGDSTIVSYYYLIVEEDTTSVPLSKFTAMGGSKWFATEEGVKNPIYQFSFVFPETQENMSVWMSDTENDIPNGSEVNITFAETSLSTPSGTLEANGTTVTVSGLTGFEADPSDSRHNTLQALTDRKAVLAVEAVDAQGRTVAMSSDTVVTVGGNQAKVSGGIAAAEIAEGTYTIEVSALPQDAVEIRVSLCYTDNSIIYKPMANVLASVTVEP